MVAAAVDDGGSDLKPVAYNLEAAPGKGDFPDTEPERPHLEVRDSFDRFYSTASPLPEAHLLSDASWAAGSSRDDVGGDVAVSRL